MPRITFFHNTHILDKLLFAFLFLWIWYLATGFRYPLSPILLSDENQGSSIRQLLFAATGGIGFIRLFLYKNLDCFVKRFFPYTLLGLLLIASILWSQNINTSVKRTLIFILGFIALVAIISYRKCPINSMIHFIVHSTFAISACSIILYLIFPAEFSVNPARPGMAGISNHPNSLAPFLSIGFIFSFAAQPISKTFLSKIFFHLQQATLLLGLILTTSVTTILTTLIGCLLYLWFSSNAYKKGVYQILAFASLLLISIIGPDQIKQQFFASTGRDESLSGRDELWIKVWQEANKNPILGVGYGAFWTEGKGRELVQTWNPRQSHNAFLDVFVELGIAGVLMVLFLIPIRSYFLTKPYLSLGGVMQKKLAVLLSVLFAYLFFYGQAQSFLLKLDSFPFLIMFWTCLLFSGGKNSAINQETKQDYENCPIS